MKKIIFLEVVQSFGGARKSTLELAKGLSKDYDVEIWDLYGTCQPFIEACKEYGVKTRILDQRDDMLIISSHRFFARLWNTAKYFLHCIRINNKILTEVKGLPCIFVVNNSKVLTLLFRKPANSTVILFARGWFLPQQILKKDRFLYKHLVDKYACVSEATRHAMYCAKLASLNNLFVVHNAIDLPVKVNNKNESLVRSHALQLLFSGGFLPTKGQWVALEIAKALKKEGLDFKIVICGIIYEGDASKRWYDWVVSEIEKHNLSENIELIINHHNVMEYFQWCDIFVHPSDTEGLPRVVMEAMAMRKPVVANAVGGVSDYILHGFTGLITRHNNVKDYVDSILRLHTDKNLYENIANHAYALIAETFTKENQLKAMQELICENSDYGL